MKKFKDILKVIFLMLAILTMAVSLFGRAFAAESTEMLNSWLNAAGLSSEMKENIFSIYRENPYYIAYVNSSTHNFILLFSPIDDFSISSVNPPEFNINTTSDTTNSVFSSNNNLVGNTFYYVLLNSSGDNGINAFSITPVNSSSVVFNSTYNVYYSLFSNNIVTRLSWSKSSGTNGSLYPHEQTLKYSSGHNFYVTWHWWDRLNGKYYISNEFSPDIVSVNSDISVYKSLDNNGLPVLNVSWSKTPLPSTGGINYAGYTNVDIKFNIDGSERVVSINSDDYPELFSNYADGKFYIPWSVFQKVALLVTDYDQVNEVSVVQVDVSMKGYPQSASIESAQVYSMNTLVDPALVFKGQDNSIPVFDNDQIVKQPDEDVSINVTEYNDYIQSFNSYRNSDGLWHLVSSYDNDTNSDILHINAYVDDPNSPDGYVIDHFSLDSSGGTLNDGAYFSDYFYENAYTLDYDMIVFHVFVDRRPAAVDFVPTFNGYIVYYTNRYYLRLLNTQAVNISDLFRVSNNYAYMTYDFLFDRLNNINDNLISYFVSDSNKQNTAISYLGSINVGLNNLNSNFVNLTASTHNYLDRILSAVNGIDFEGTDLTGVLSKMDSISSSVSSLPNAIRSDLVYLFKPSYDDIDVSFQQYKDSIGILSLPFDTSKMVLETVDQNYNGKLSIDVPKIKFMSYELFGGQHYELDPWQFFNDQELSEGDDPTGQGFVKGLRYFIAFSAILGAVLGTYLHIFRRKES